MCHFPVVTGTKHLVKRSLLFDLYHQVKQSLGTNCHSFFSSFYSFQSFSDPIKWDQGEQHENFPSDWEWMGVKRTGDGGNYFSIERFRNKIDCTGHPALTPLKMMQDQLSNEHLDPYAQRPPHLRCSAMWL